MLIYPDIDPVAFYVGSWPVRWYGLTYLAGFVAFWLLGRYRAKKSDGYWTTAQIDDLLFYGAIGVIVGGRLGYILFYDLGYTLDNPDNLFRIWQGGMSFHGGLCGVIVAVAIFARSLRRPFFDVADFVIPLIPLALGFGRIGNFINAELWGKPTDLPWGVLVPGLGDNPVHPSQLYQAFLEGVVLFVLLWWFSGKPRPRMAVSALFLIGYGAFRFLVEFVRVPDQHLGYLFDGWLTMGQILSTPMVILGLIMMIIAYRRGIQPAEPTGSTSEMSPDEKQVSQKRRKRKKK